MLHENGQVAHRQGKINQNHIQTAGLLFVTPRVVLLFP